MSIVRVVFISRCVNMMYHQSKYTWKKEKKQAFKEAIGTPERDEGYTYMLSLLAAREDPTERECKLEFSHSTSLFGYFVSVLGFGRFIISASIAAVGAR